MVRLSQPFVLLIIFALRVSCFRTEISIKFRNLVHKNQYLRSARHDAIEEHTITQPVDHVAAKGKNVTFKQRYWVNPSYWRKSDGPVFLYIGGEFEMSGDFIDYGQLLNFSSFYPSFRELPCTLGCKQAISFRAGASSKATCSLPFVHYRYTRE